METKRRPKKKDVVVQEKYELRFGCNTTLFRVLRANSTHQFTLKKEEERSKTSRDERERVERKKMCSNHPFNCRKAETRNLAYKTMTQS